MAAVLGGWLMKTGTLRSKTNLFLRSLVDFFKRHLYNLPVSSVLCYLYGPLENACPCCVPGDTSVWRCCWCIICSPWSGLLFQTLPVQKKSLPKSEINGFLHKGSIIWHPESLYELEVEAIICLTQDTDYLNLSVCRIFLGFPVPSSAVCHLGFSAFGLFQCWVPSSNYFWAVGPMNAVLPYASPAGGWPSPRKCHLSK